MNATEANTERLRILSLKQVAPGFPVTARYTAITVRAKADAPTRHEVVGERKITRNAVRAVKGISGQPDTLQTVSETVSVFDILAH